MDAETLHEALLTAVGKADGNQSRFAKDIGTVQQNVSYWLKRRKPLPAEYVLAAERAGYGSRHELRPDLYPMDCPPAGATFCQPGAGEAGGKDEEFTPSDEPKLPLVGSYAEPELPIIGAAA